MSGWLNPPIDPSTTTDTDPSATNSSSNNPEDPDSAQAYNYLFFLIALSGLIFLIVLAILTCRRHKLWKKARRQVQRSRSDASAQDIESRAGRHGENARRSPYWGRLRADNDSILNAGLDERGVAPPDYRAATAPRDKFQDVPPYSIPVRSSAGGEMDAEVVPVPRISRVEAENAGRPAPPCYDETPGSPTTSNTPARPPAAVVVPRRSDEPGLGEQGPDAQHAAPRISRIQGSWSSIRRLFVNTGRGRGGPSAA